MAERGPYVPRQAPARKNSVPDEHVADMRYLHEEERKTHAQVRAKYSQYSKSYVRSVLEYAVRADVKPAPRDV
jgi:hypothetical protein